MRNVKKIVVVIFLLLMSNLSGYALQGISGRVTCEGKGIGGVVVTDGNYCTITNAQGKYIIPSVEGAPFVYLSTPAGYLPTRDNSCPLFFQRIDADKQVYNFKIAKNQKNDIKHTLLVHADPQLFKQDNLKPYNIILDDCKHLIDTTKNDIFGIDCGDLVGDKPELYPAYIQSVDRLGIPFYRVIGNHDMTLHGRSHETSYTHFEKLFGPAYYSFNRGKAHYVVLNDIFYLGRDYFYMGYLAEKLLAWLEKDLSFVKPGSLVFVAMHIPSRLEEERLAFEYTNANISCRVSNAAFLYQLLEPFNAHIVTGHMHYNRNIAYSSTLYEHITAAVCGTWWQGSVCLDGTPQGYGVYEIDGDQLTWYFKSVGFPKTFQMRAYAVGSSLQYPADIIANVWNWDKKWRVEWLEDGVSQGEMIRFEGIDPDAEKLCADKEKLEFKWIAPMANDHMFRATPKNKKAKIEIRVTDRFGNIYHNFLN